MTRFSWSAVLLVASFIPARPLSGNIESTWERGVVKLSPPNEFGGGSTWNFTVLFQEPFHMRPEVLMTGFVLEESPALDSPIVPNPPSYALAISTLNTDVDRALGIVTLLKRDDVESLMPSYDLAKGLKGAKLEAPALQLTVVFYAWVPESLEECTVLVPNIAGRTVSSAVTRLPDSGGPYIALATVKSPVLRDAVVVTTASVSVEDYLEFTVASASNQVLGSFTRVVKEFLFF
mmetsp:Transcript_52740/g.120190  ORF Transcript_52740/g.120190 Transcript_52740/m.120190 type:complete len:234 (+) Transcript_52740:191-892(+)